LINELAGSMRVSNVSGGVSIQEMGGSIVVTNVDGTIDIIEMTGQLRVDNISYPGSVSIQTAKDTSGAGDVVVEELLTGSLTISEIEAGDFFIYIFSGISETGALSLGHMGAGTIVFVGVSAAEDMAGTIQFPEGIDSGAPVAVGCDCWRSRMCCSMVPMGDFITWFPRPCRLVPIRPPA
jgi:hypothetical protein